MIYIKVLVTNYTRIQYDKIMIINILKIYFFLKLDFFGFGCVSLDTSTVEFFDFGLDVRTPLMLVRIWNGNMSQCTRFFIL